MRIIGGARNGYCSMLRPRSVATPIITMRIEMTMATMGRRMKNWAMGLLLVPRRGRLGGVVPRLIRGGLLRLGLVGVDRHGLRHHLHAGADLLQAVHEHLVVRL